MNDDAAPVAEAPGPAAQRAHGPEHESEQPQEEAGFEARIRAVRQDPLSEARGAEDRIAAAQAYESFQRSVTAAGPVGVVGPAIGSQFHFYSFAATSASTPFEPGPVRAERLVEVTECYAPTPSDPELRSALSADHLVVLKGSAGSGRTTTALRLLLELAPGRVQQLSTRVSVTDLDEERIAEGHGYIGELAPGSQPLTEVDLDRLASKLKKRGAYCVLVPSPEDADEFAGHYLHTHVMPLPLAIFEQRIEMSRKRAPAGEVEYAEALRLLITDREFTELLGLRPEPCEEVWLAEFAEQIADGRLDRAELVPDGGKLLDRRLEAWLARLPEGVELQRYRRQVEEFAFRFALAVLNDSPVHLVWEAAARLAWELYTTADPRFTPGRAVFSRLDEDVLIRQVKARLHNGSTEVSDAVVPARLLAYQQPAVAVRLLSAVWNGRPNLRRPVLRWLQDLSQDPRPDLWMRAALTIGLLTSWDFAFSYHEAVEQWVRAGSPKQRLVASIALVQAGRAAQTRSAVKALIKQWAGSDERGQLWTAALVLGYESGDGEAGPALRMLRCIGLWHDGDLGGLAASSVADLFARGRFADVLAAVDSWVVDARLEHHVFGLSCSVRLALLRVRDLGGDELELEEADRQWLAHPDRAAWPLVVVLARVSPRLGRTLADCVRHAFAGSFAASVMRDEISGWIRSADSAPEALEPLSDFLQFLIDDADDEARLLDAVAMLASDPDDPISADTATALTAAITRRMSAVDAAPSPAE